MGRISHKKREKARRENHGFPVRPFAPFVLSVAKALQLISRRPAFQKALHAWYRVHHRKLPWRDAPSLYKTVVSEFMLQQTQVAPVLPYFDRWLRQLPDFATLAAAPAPNVLTRREGPGSSP